MVIKRMGELEREQREEAKRRAEKKRKREAEWAAGAAAERAVKKAQRRKEEAERQQRLARTKQILRDSGALDGLEEIRQEVGRGLIFGRRTELEIDECGATLRWDFHRERETEAVTREYGHGRGGEAPYTTDTEFVTKWVERYRSITVWVKDDGSLRIGFNTISADDRSRVTDALAKAFQTEQRS